VSSTREGTGTSTLLDSELRRVREAIPALERDLAAADDELSRAHVIRRHVARNPERFAPHEREDVFERVERLTGRRQELSAQLKAAGERQALLESLREAVEVEMRELTGRASAAELAARSDQQARSQLAGLQQALEQARAEAAAAAHAAQAAQADAAAVRQALAEAQAAAQAAAQAPASALEVHQAVEAERLRIARELHDGPAQVMSNLVLEAEILERLLKRDPALLQAELQQFRNAVTNAVADVRRFMFDLRPGSLDDLGLIATLRRFTGDWQQQSGIVCRFNLTGEDRRLPPGLEETMFRIVQEALANVRRHAEARTVEVDLDVRPDRVRLRIRDDGRGFDPEAPQTGQRRLGLVGMRERAAAAGGQLEVRSGPGAGTEVEGDFPVI
jgi:two-component system sensor histidine kinase DegS